MNKNISVSDMIDQLYKEWSKSDGDGHRGCADGVLETYYGTDSAGVKWEVWCQGRENHFCIELHRAPECGDNSVVIESVDVDCAPAPYFPALGALRRAQAHQKRIITSEYKNLVEALEMERESPYCPPRVLDCK